MVSVSRAVASCVAPAAVAGAERSGSWPAVRALLGVPGFVRLSAGNGLALSGQRLQSLAIAWLVLEMTGSKMMMGVVVGLPALAVVGASLLGGVLADSSHARSALRWTRLAMAGAACFAALMVTSGQADVGLLVGVALVTAVATAIDMPVSRTLTVEMVGRERALPGAAATSLAMNVCATVGPVAIGLLIAWYGVDVALYGVAVSYALSAVLLPPIERTESDRRNVSPWEDVRAGLTYLRETPCVAWLVGLLFLVPVAGMFFAMVPVLGREVLAVGPGGIGLLMASYGAGTVVGSAYLVVSGQMRHRGVRVTTAGVLFGLCVVAFALSQALVAAFVLAFVIGVTAMLWLNTLSAMVQVAAAPEMKGRAMSVGTMGIQLMGGGWLVAGALSSALGPVTTAVFGGAAFAALSVLAFVRSADVRAID